MSNDGISAADLDRAVVELEPTLDPVALRERLKLEAAISGTPWKETPGGNLSNAAVASVMESAVMLKAALEALRADQLRERVAEQQVPEMRPCPRNIPGCESHRHADEHPGTYRKHMGFGIVLEHTEADSENAAETILNWIPDWADWVMKPSEVRAELRELRNLLSRLDFEVDEFARSLDPDAQTTVAVEEDLRPCAVDGCLLAVHPWRDGGVDEDCVASRIDRPEHGYTVHGARGIGDNHWAAWADVNNVPDGADGVLALEVLLADFRATQEHCEKLNKNGESK